MEGTQPSTAGGDGAPTARRRRSRRWAATTAAPTSDGAGSSTGLWGPQTGGTLEYQIELDMSEGVSTLSAPSKARDAACEDKGFPIEL